MTSSSPPRSDAFSLHRDPTTANATSAYPKDRLVTLASRALSPITTAALSTHPTSGPSGSLAPHSPASSSPSLFQQFRDLVKSAWPPTLRESSLLGLFKDTLLRRNKEIDQSPDEADLEELNILLSQLAVPSPSSSASSSSPLGPSPVLLSLPSTRSGSPTSVASAPDTGRTNRSDMETDEADPDNWQEDEELVTSFILDALFASGDSFCLSLHTEASQLMNHSRSAFFALRAFVQSSGLYFSEQQPSESDSVPAEELKDDAVDLFTWEALQQADCRPLIIHLSGPLARNAMLKGQSPSTVTYPSTVVVELNGETNHGTIFGQPVSWKHGSYAVTLSPLLELFEKAAAEKATLRVNFLIHSHLDAEPLRGHIWVMSAAAEAEARKHPNESDFASQLFLVPFWPSTIYETQSFLDVSPQVSCLSLPQQSRFRKELALLNERIRSVGPRERASPVLLGSLALIRLGLIKEGIAALVLAAMGNHIALARLDEDTQRGSQSQRDALLQGAELFCRLMLQKA